MSGLSSVRDATKGNSHETLEDLIAYECSFGLHERLQVTWGACTRYDLRPNRPVKPVTLGPRAYDERPEKTIPRLNFILAGPSDVDQVVDKLFGISNYKIPRTYLSAAAPGRIETVLCFNTSRNYSDQVKQVYLQGHFCEAWEGEGWGNIYEEKGFGYVMGSLIVAKAKSALSETLPAYQEQYPNPSSRGNTMNVQLAYADSLSLHLRGEMALQGLRNLLCDPEQHGAQVNSSLRAA